jgi:hypothetical protein
MSDKEDLGKRLEREFESVTEEQLEKEFNQASKGGPGWWEDRSLLAKIIMGIGFGILGVIFIILMIFLVMTVWNRVMPAVFNLPQVTYWQTMGLLFLSFVFFHRMGGSGDSKKTDRKRKRNSASIWTRLRDRPETGEE